MAENSTLLHPSSNTSGAHVTTTPSVVNTTSNSEDSSSPDSVAPQPAHLASILSPIAVIVLVIILSAIVTVCIICCIIWRKRRSSNQSHTRPMLKEHGQSSWNVYILATVCTYVIIQHAGYEIQLNCYCVWTHVHAYIYFMVLFAQWREHTRSPWAFWRVE